MEVTAIKTEPSVTETGTPELGDGEGEDPSSRAGGKAMDGGDGEIGCRDITSINNLWPFLQ